MSLLAISTTAYFIFYYNYIPQIDLERVIYLQYGLGPYPHATTALDTTALIPQQPYDIQLILHMPRTPNNLAAGNFMLDLALLGSPTATPQLPASLSSLLPNISSFSIQHHSRRPAILPYESPILSLSHSLLHLPWHVLRFQDLDASTLVVPMFELLSFPRGSRNVPTHIRFEVQSDSILQIYDAKIVFRARFQGIRYLIYNYRILAFLFFTTIFYSISLLTMAVAWTLIPALLFGKKPGDSFLSIKSDPESDARTAKAVTAKSEPRVKTEDDDSSSVQGLSISNLSDTPTTFPTRHGQLPLQYSRQPFKAGESTEELVAHPQPSMQQGDVADDEDESAKALENLGMDEYDDDDEDFRGRRYDGDSGIGTSMESEIIPASTVRRRKSGLSVGSGSSGRK